MKPAKAGMLVVGLWMGVGGLPAGPGRDGASGALPTVAGWFGEGVAAAANPQAEGRKHARKANHLADINKCKLAIPEFTKALRLLKDPTLLFNRAECYRRTGDTAKAVADYRKFLVELPAAPNRAQVESQIAALDRSGGKSAAASASAPASKATAPRATAAPAKAAPPEPVATTAPPLPPVASPPAPVVATPPSPSVAEEPAREAPAAPAAEPEAPDLDRPRRPPRLRVTAKREPTPALIDSASQHPEASEGSSHWWAWVLGAAVIAGGVTGTYFLLKQGKTDIPSSDLGNYKF
jgi:hypothetical protein